MEIHTINFILTNRYYMPSFTEIHTGVRVRERDRVSEGGREREGEMPLQVD